MGEIDRKNPIIDGDIDYGRVFVTFTQHTEQKITHGLLLESLLRALKERGNVLKDREPTTLVDLGCGEGHTAYEMIDAINRVHPQGRGVNYYGLDSDERFVRSTQRLLERFQDEQRLQLINVQRADVLKGEPLPIASTDDVLATMGHVLYYAHSREGGDQTRKNVAAIIDSITGLLGRDGLCLLVHSAASCPLATLRASVADSIEAKPTSIVADVAEEKHLIVMSLAVPFRLRFPSLSSRLWDKTRDLDRYRAELGSDKQLTTTLELLTFVAQRGLKSLADAGKLEVFVEALRAQLDENAVLHGLSEYQLLLSPIQSPELEASIGAALEQVGQSLDRIGREARQTFDRRAL